MGRGALCVGRCDDVVMLLCDDWSSGGLASRSGVPVDAVIIFFFTFDSDTLSYIYLQPAFAVVRLVRCAAHKQGTAVLGIFKEIANFCK